jgi:hypothetical protein
MPLGLSNTYGRIFFIKLVLHTLLDKEAHKRIIYEYILNLKISELNNMEVFQQEWKKITNHIIKQYQKIDPPFQTVFTLLVLTGSEKAQTKYGWLCTLLEWTNITCHDLITRNLWPKP